MIRLVKYCGEDPGTPCLINALEIAAVEEYRFHSFRPAISRVTLQSGVRLIVWEAMDQIADALTREETP